MRLVHRQSRVAELVSGKVWVSVRFAGLSMCCQLAAVAVGHSMHAAAVPSLLCSLLCACGCRR